MIQEVKEIENDVSGDLKSSRSDQDDVDDDRDGDDHNDDGFNSICVPWGRWQR